MLKYLSIILGVLVLIIVQNETIKSNASGSPGNYSGVNGYTCTDCHRDYNVNSGTGFVRATLLDSIGKIPTLINPYQSYRLGIKVSGKSAAAWGFVAYFKSTSGKNGLLSATSNNAQIKTGNFATHSKDTADTFSIKWIAPSNGDKSIKLYLAGNVANGDGDIGGDHIYNTVYTYSINQTNSINNDKSTTNLIKVYSIGDKKIRIESPLNENFRVRIFDLKGKIAYNQELKTGVSEIKLESITLQGVYLVEIENSTTYLVKKLFIQ